VASWMPPPCAGAGVTPPMRQASMYSTTSYTPVRPTGLRRGGSPSGISGYRYSKRSHPCALRIFRRHSETRLIGQRRATPDIIQPRVRFWLKGIYSDLKQLPPLELPGLLASQLADVHGSLERWDDERMADQVRFATQIAGLALAGSIIARCTQWAHLDDDTAGCARTLF
jgi:hypothetical protein